MNEINPYEREMSTEQINRNFIAMNDWMKLERKRTDELVEENEKLRRNLATLTGRLTEMERKQNLLAVSMLGHGPTGE